MVDPPNDEDETNNDNGTTPKSRSFLNQLSNQYWSIHSMTIKDSFRTEFIRSGLTHPSTLWTSSFICPVDGHVYEAGGDLVGDEYREQKTIDGVTKWYYASKKNSIQAAAMQAIGNPNLQSNTSSETSETSTTPPAVTNKQNLSNWYQRNHQLTLGEDNFRTQKRSIAGSKAKGGIWWTATFTCPVDGQEFKSMDASASEVLEKIWFRKKGDAIQAAAAHALYIKQLEAAENKSRQEDEEESWDEDNSESLVDDPSSSIVPTIQTAETIITRAPLVIYYQKHHKVTITNQDFVASLASFKGKRVGGNWWTATFLCPVTGERYDSKQLRVLSVASPSQCYQDAEGTIWYKRKEDSILAAALGALDTLKFKESGALEPRYCKEDPSESILVEEEPIVMDEDVKLTNENTVLSSSFITSAPEEGIVEDDDDGFIIEVVPQRFGFGNDSGNSGGATTTFDLIAETWLESTNIQPKMDASKPRFRDFSKEKNEAIERAKSWIEVQRETLDDDDGRRTHFDGYEPVTNVKTANLILDSLASANRLRHLSEKPFGVEQAASAVLDYMWSTKTTRPNANSYASYIKCIEADSPSSLSKKVQEIYDAMVSQKKYGGRILPRPNTAVYNSLIQRLAEAGFETSINDIDTKIQPNKETFLSALSSMKHPSDRTESHVVFDIEKARKNIEQMKALSVETTIDAYNAPLRWVGGLAASLSRPYSDCAPWDSYETDFQKGFKVLLSDHPLLKEAENVEKWFNLIHSGEFGNEIRPNIETLESLIQAWVRTTTRDGLEKACNLTEDILNKGEHQLRLQSFHPILAAWVYSGAEDGPQKVDYWLQRLQSAGLPVMEDGRYRSAPILARLSRQRQLMRERDVYELANEKSTDFRQMAVESSDHLIRLIADYKEDESFFIGADTFKLAIQGWYNVGDACSRMGDVTGTDEALAAIENLTQSFDDLVQYLYTSGGENAAMQLLHLLGSAPYIYSIFLSALKDFDFNHQARKMDVEKPKFMVNHLISIERNLRRSEEFRLCTDEMVTRANILYPESAPFENGVSVHYEDMFSFSAGTLSRPDLAINWPSFLDENMRALEEIKSETGNGYEVTRICLLVAEVMMKQEAGRGSYSKGPLMKVLKSTQNTSPGLSTLFDAVQKVYNPRKKNSAGPNSNSQTKSADSEGFLNGSTRNGLRRRKPTRSRANQQRNSDIQQNSTQKRRQQAS